MKKNTKKTKESIGILGFGEIGQAVAKFYKNPKIKDLKRDDGLENLDILHVCIPYGKKFVNIVKKEIAVSHAKLTIVHSTVVPGTIKKIGGRVVHSPVRGVHPKLHEGIKTFIKYIGADDRAAGLAAKKHLQQLGINVKLFDSSVTTELGKILDTTYYGVAIAWHKEMKKICDKLGVNFDHAVTDFNQTYNAGYAEMDMHHVIRPVLYVDTNPIGGHCVVPNAKLLKNYVKSKAIDLILNYEES